MSFLQKRNWPRWTPREIVDDLPGWKSKEAVSEPDVEAIFDAKNRHELGYVPGKESPKKTYLQKMEDEELDKMEGSNE